MQRFGAPVKNLLGLLHAIRDECSYRREIAIACIPWCVGDVGRLWIPAVVR